MKLILRYMYRRPGHPPDMQVEAASFPDATPKGVDKARTELASFAKLVNGRVEEVKDEQKLFDSDVTLNIVFTKGVSNEHDENVGVTDYRENFKGMIKTIGRTVHAV